MNLIAANDNFKSNAVRFVVEPRLVPVTKAARRLHLTAAEFAAKKDQFEAADFPPPCSITGFYDLHAIDAWLDRRANGSGGATTAALNANDVVMQRLMANG